MKYFFLKKAIFIFWMYRKSHLFVLCSVWPVSSIAIVIWIIWHVSRKKCSLNYPYGEGKLHLKVHLIVQIWDSIGWLLNNNIMWLPIVFTSFKDRIIVFCHLSQNLQLKVIHTAWVKSKVTCKLVKLFKLFLFPTKTAA